MKNILKDWNKIFIIAELSGNHNGNKEYALESVREAKRIGADAIKIQTYTPDTMTLDVKSNDFLLTQGTIWDGSYLHDLYKFAYTPWEWHQDIFRVAAEEGIICFSTPFDKSSVDFLERLNNPIYKIASFEITDIPLIEYVALKGKPIIISTGIANLEDIELAVETCIKNGNSNITLLKCTSSYPSPKNEANLTLIQELSNKFNLSSGLSDHTLGITAPIVAASLGAKVIEKHFILDKSIGGPDASFSLDKNEFKEMIDKVREAEILLGEKSFDLTEKQKQGRNFSRSLYISKDVKVGEVVSENNIRSVRPGYGLHPKYFDKIIGKKFKYDIKKGTRMNFDLIN